jgi:hypothetical protein
MKVFLSVGPGRSPAANEGEAAMFPWPETEPLVVPNEGEYAEFFGKPPRRVQSVTYRYEMGQGGEPGVVSLSVHLQTA